MSKKQGLYEQFTAVREAYPDTVIFFQVGGFYQMYYYDAVLSEKVLGMKLLTRAMGKGKIAPMCGFPLSSMEKYADGLTAEGYSVAVCRQMDGEDGDVMRAVDFIKEPKEEVEPRPYKAEWEEYMRNFSEDSLKLESASQEKNKAPKKERNLAKKLLKELEELDMDNVSPMDAFHFVERWREKVLKDKQLKEDSLKVEESQEKIQEEENAICK